MFVMKNKTKFYKIALDAWHDVTRDVARDVARSGALR